MVRLTAKGNNPYVALSLPINVARVESDVVLASLRDAVESMVVMAESDSSTPTDVVVKQIISLKKILDELSAETEALRLMVRAVEKRVMAFE